MSNFNQVVIRNVTQHDRNVHLAVHPFPCDDGIRMMTYKGDYGDSWKAELAEWKQRLADALWDGIPGLHLLFFANGGITLQHNGVFTDGEIIEAASDIIRPVLAGQLLLQQVDEAPAPPERPRPPEWPPMYEDWTLERPLLEAQP